MTFHVTTSALKYLSLQIKPLNLRMPPLSLPGMDANGRAAAKSQPSPAPSPMLSANVPPPFLVKTYDMVEDTCTNRIVSWGPKDNTFVVWDPPEFSRDLLPKYFRHNNFASFVRQLNTYGFRKVDPDRWEFANEGFLRGQKHLLKSINRRRHVHGHNNQKPHQPNKQSPSTGACVEVGKFGLEEEVERLKRDKNILMQELVRLRQEQQNTDNQLQSTVQRLQGMEHRQQQMMSFLVEAMNSPGFLAQIVQQKNESNRRIGEGNKKRRIKSNGDGTISDNQIVKYQPMMNEEAKSAIKQIMKSDATLQLENLENGSDDFLVTDSGLMTHSSGMNLQEVFSSNGPSFSELNSGVLVQRPSLIATNSEMVSSTVVGDQNLPSLTVPPINSIIPEPSLQMVPESRADMTKTTTSGLNDAIPSTLNFMDAKLEWEDNLLGEDLENLPGIDDPFWQQLFSSPLESGENEDMDSVSIDISSDENEAKPLENHRDKAQNMEQITKQMRHLTSETQKECIMVPKCIDISLDST